MGLKFTAAKATGALLTWGLQNIMHRDGATMPGKYALKVDPNLLTGLAPRLKEGSILVVGTNGKTSVTNLLADTLEAAGKSVACNRTGANLSWGVASSLLQTKGAQWGVFETDELWIARVLPHLKSDYVVLLNLFSDQLDRFGEIDRVQESIVGTLKTSQETVLVYNADDPMCAAIANAAPNRKIAFGVAERMAGGLAEEGDASFAQTCQQCGGVLGYGYRQYAHLGEFACPTCGFARAELDFAAREVGLTDEGLSFEVAAKNGESWRVSTSQATAYMVYNLLAVETVAKLLGVSPEVTQRAIAAFNPQNGRLQRFSVQGHDVLLNLAKNPTGFNQNLDIIMRSGGPKAVAFFVNDMEGDGRDASWIWDVAFERLREAEAAGLKVYVGGMRKNDLQVRLKYAGLKSQLIDKIDDVFADLARCGGAGGSGVPTADRAEGVPMADRVDGAQADTMTGAHVYAIANYTALPPVLAALNALAAEGDAACGGVSAVAEVAVGDVAELGKAAVEEGVAAPSEDFAELDDNAAADNAFSADKASSASPLVIAHLFPELLAAQGCGGNVSALQKRCEWRGIPVEVLRVTAGDARTADISQADLVFVGEGSGRERALAEEGMKALEAQMQKLQAEGAFVLDMRDGFSQLEDHLETQCQGPLLAFSPKAADRALQLAFAHHASRTGESTPDLKPLDDAEELAASAFMKTR